MDRKEKKYELEDRTKKFAVQVIRFIYNQERNIINSVLFTQLIKAGTSIGANYREANRAESKKDFIHKIGIVQKEASETQYWLEVLLESKIIDSDGIELLLAEATELLAIFTAIGKTAKKNSTFILFSFLAFLNSKF
jgi:four helix bundle protein